MGGPSPKDSWKGMVSAMRLGCEIDSGPAGNQTSQLFLSVDPAPAPCKRRKERGTRSFGSSAKVRGTRQELKTVAPLLSITPITVVDRTGRPVARVGANDDGSEGRLFQQLAHTIGFYQPFLSYVIEAVMAEFKPSVDDILTVLYQSPLFLESRRGIL